MREHQTDYLEGQVMFDIEIHQMKNGQYKATSQGLECNDPSQEYAVSGLQILLHEAMLKGELFPDG